LEYKKEAATKSSVVTSGSIAEEKLDRVFSALADQTRRGLLSRLAEKPATVTELAAPWKMSLPAVSKHIRVLERAGLVTRTVDGRVHRCSLSAVPLRDAELFIARYRSFWEETLDSLARYVERDPARRRRRHA
jgi:DNA-binding transcriptional ArsR family regulator